MVVVLEAKDDDDYDDDDDDDDDACVGVSMWGEIISKIFVLLLLKKIMVVFIVDIYKIHCFIPVKRKQSSLMSKTC